MPRGDFPTPYAGVNRIRFEGLRPSALSAPTALPCLPVRLPPQWPTGPVGSDLDSAGRRADHGQEDNVRACAVAPRVCQSFPHGCII